MRGLKVLARQGSARGQRTREGIEPPIVAPLAGRVKRRRWRTAGSLALRTRGGRPWAWTLLWGGLALAASLRLITIALDPILATYHSTIEIRTLEAEFETARRSNEHLRRQIAYLNSRAGIEEEARRLGWVRAGELPLRIVRGSTHAAQSTAAEAGTTGEPGDRETARALTIRSDVDPGAASPEGVAPRETGAAGIGAMPRLLTPPAALPDATAAVSGPEPRTPVAERIQQGLANWGVTKWLGEALKGSVER